MAFLDPNSWTPTLAEKQASAASSIRSASANQYATLVAWQKAGISAVWNNPDGLTPQQVCDALGADAVKAFDLHAKLTEAVMQLAQIGGVQPDIALPSHAFTRNADGTVTVLDAPYVP